MPFHNDFENLNDFLGENTFRFDGGRIQIECEPGERQGLQNYVEGSGFDTRPEGTDGFSFRLHHDQFDIFFNEDDFKSNFHTSESRRDIYLVQTSINGAIRFSHDEQKALNHDGEPLAYYFFNNYFSYEKVKTILDDSRIVDHKDGSTGQFILLSSKQGKFRLGYNNVTPNFNVNEDLSDKPQKLKDVLENGNDYFRFLKEVMISRLGTEDKPDRAYNFFVELDSFIEEANRNYEVFLNKFDFAKLRDELRQEKEKYLSSVQELISKLFNKVVSVPISISAAAFALYRVKENSVLSILVVVGYVAYAIFTSYLLKIAWDDTQEIESDFEDDIDKIESKSPLNEEDIKSVNQKMSRRFNYLRTSIVLVGVIIIGFAIAITTIGVGFIASSLAAWMKFFVLIIPTAIILTLVGVVL
ncbi:hypothetical protein LX73_2283 [Fodinibius salinus]|uniref:Uncharacterized protein n=1 Tax=Fodinibius salinus TaxID=860790 RepID=A0A5D3YEY4_9BACT|nr:hypothetical protein [Fodinibius salinus]TYP92037.1 hypothetical protein LX73_2283 [Fodinibius salinus]